MSDPVYAADGHTYEKVEVQRTLPSMHAARTKRTAHTAQRQRQNTHDTDNADAKHTRQKQKRRRSAHCLSKVVSRTHFRCVCTMLSK
eukprot:2862739-Rhodomonas_salina.1